MPSQKTAEKTAEKTVEKPKLVEEPLIEVLTLKPFGKLFSKEEAAKKKAADRENRDYSKDTYTTKKGDIVFVSKEDAKKLQKAGAIEIVL